MEYLEIIYQSCNYRVILTKEGVYKLIREVKAEWITLNSSKNSYIVDEFIDYIEQKTDDARHDLADLNL